MESQTLWCSVFDIKIVTRLTFKACKRPIQHTPKKKNCKIFKMKSVKSGQNFVTLSLCATI